VIDQHQDGLQDVSLNTHLEVPRKSSGQTGDDDGRRDGTHSNTGRSEEVGESYKGVAHQLGTSLCTRVVLKSLTSSHTQHSSLGRPITEASGVQVVSRDTGKVDNDPSFFIGHEESLTLFGRVLSVDSVCYVGVDDKGTDGLLKKNTNPSSARHEAS